MIVAGKPAPEQATWGSRGIVARRAGGDSLSDHTDAPPLRAHNLFHDAAALLPMLAEQAERGAWLDAYLIGCGLSQMVADYLHPDPFMLGKVADVLADLPTPMGARAAALARAARTQAIGLAAMRPSRRRLTIWDRRLSAVLEQLADAVAGAERSRAPAGEPPSSIAARCQVLVEEAATFPPELLRMVCRLPSCFRSFDQQPADLERIAHRFAGRWPDRQRPLIVVGVRTSGSFLAPLYTAYLRAAGYREVTTLTVRPGRALTRHEQRALRALVQRDALVLLADDPPQSGKSVARAAGDLERLGVPRASIVLLLQTFGIDDTLPPALQEYAAVVLPWAGWAIQTRLAPGAVGAALERLAGPDVRIIGQVERLPLPPASSPRSHARALYEVQIEEHGHPRVEQILVRGTGLGYFGRQTLAVADALDGFLPRVYGFENGLLFRTWVPADQAVTAAASPSPSADSEFAEAAVAYVVARRRALAVPEDISARMLGEWPAWEVASNTLSQVFGRAWMAARIPLVDPVVRRLLRASQPAVIDANMVLNRWFVRAGDEENGQPVVKVGFDEGIFRGDVELACYDPVLDLATLVANLDSADGSGERASAMTRTLRAGYQRETGEQIDEERWLLYQLVRLWDEQRAAGGSPGARRRLTRSRARALQRYYTATHFADVAAPAAGPICALDVDGVLETSAYGFPGLTPASAVGLRALAQHGYRVVLATGRSLDEVRERCHAYSLAGGVAEYGAALYVKATGQVADLLSGPARADLARLRSVLLGLDGVHLDPDYRFAIRAYRLDAKQRRRGLTREMVELATDRAGGEERLRTIHGDDQTDFVPASVDKGTGLRALLTALGEAPAPAHGRDVVEEASPLALAVGDTISDLPMLALAGLGLAPAHADAALRQSDVRVTGQPYQAGLAQAVGTLLGHAPGRCPFCRPPAPTPGARLLSRVLAVPEAGPWGIVRGALGLGLTAASLYLHDRVTGSTTRAYIGTGG